jgi:hypothetical protein
MESGNQVSSLELATRLKEFGVKQESLFYWILLGNERWEIGLKTKIDYSLISGQQLALYHAENNISAFTIAELGEMLPSPGDHNRDNVGSNAT